MADGGGRGEREKLHSFSDKTSAPTSDVSGEKEINTFAEEHVFCFSLNCWWKSSEWKWRFLHASDIFLKNNPSTVALCLCNGQNRYLFFITTPSPMDNLPEPEGSAADLQLHKTRAYSLLLTEQVVLKCNRVVLSFSQNRSLTGSIPFSNLPVFKRSRKKPSSSIFFLALTLIVAGLLLCIKIQGSTWLTWMLSQTLTNSSPPHCLMAPE